MKLLRWQTFRDPALLVVAAFALLVASPALAFETTLDFETLGLDEVVTDQFQSENATFSNAVTLVAGISLNESDFLPTSGDNVLTGLDGSGPLVIDFGSPLKAFGVSITTATTAQLVFKDKDGLVITTELVNANIGSSERVELLLAAQQISSVEISGLLSGDPLFLTIDDVSFTVPEPSAFVALAAGILPVAAAIRRRIR